MANYTEIAKKLGISKATVSLAVNNRPGVSEKTRQMVLKCIEESESGSTEYVSQRMIKILEISHKLGSMYDPEMDLRTGVHAELGKRIRELGFIYSTTVLSMEEQNAEEIIAECNQPIVAGVIVFATEMSDRDNEILAKIRKKIVLYDNDSRQRTYSSVVIDHRATIELAGDYLTGQGHSKIVYFANAKNIYNFERRRYYFKQYMQEKGLAADIIPLGDTVTSVLRAARAYFESHPVPDAMIFENYQISIGVITTLRNLGLDQQLDSDMVGIDEIPSYIHDNRFRFSYVKIPHVSRADMAVMLLNEELNNDKLSKVRICATPKFVVHS